MKNLKNQRYQITWLCAPQPENRRGVWLCEVKSQEDVWQTYISRNDARLMKEGNEFESSNFSIVGAFHEYRDTLIAAERKKRNSIIKSFIICLVVLLIGLCLPIINLIGK